MLKRARKWGGLLFLLVGFGLAILARNESSSFQKCVSDQAAEQASEKKEEGSAHVLMSLIARAPITFRCTGSFIDENSGTITALATLAIAAFTLTLWRATSGMLSAAGEQSGAMERHIREAANSAKAMQDVAKAMTTNTVLMAESVATSKQIADQQKVVTEMQLRAYVSVVIGGGLYQERGKGLRFEARPVLVNSGSTPARKVVHTAHAAIFPAPLPKDLPLPIRQNEAGGEGMIGPHQSREMSATLDRFVADADVEDIKKAKGNGLYVWGIVTYEDAFGQPRETRYCQMITWHPDGRIWGYYTPNRNNTT
jgi:hypothetical protein